MRQQYKLRLGDGTVLAVDHDGLSIWEADRNAMVQPLGSRHWKPLKAFLAQDRAAARRAARQQPKPPSTPREALPLVYPEPRQPERQPPPRQRDGPDASRRRRASASLRTAVRPSHPTGAPGAPSPVPQLPPPVAPPEPPPVEVTVDLSPIEQPLLEQPLIEEPPLEQPLAEQRPVEAPPVAPPVAPRLGGELPRTGVEPATASLPADEDIEWMELPDPSDHEPRASAISWQGPLASASSGRVRPVRAAPPEARPRPAPAPESPVAPPIDRPERRDPQEAPQRLGTTAGSAYGTLLALLKSVAQALVTPWKRLAREALPRPSIAPHVPVASRTAGAERGAPLEPRGPADVPPPARTATPTSTGPGDVYRPRRSAADGLPILQLEADDSEGAWLELPSSTSTADEELPTLELEPLDDDEQRPAPCRTRR